MTHSASHPAGHHDDGHHGHYVAPVSLLWKVFGALVFFTVLTVATGTADWIPGALHVPLALTIALVKVVLVAMIFMGLKHDNRVNTVILVLTTIFVIVFLGFTLFDVTQRGDLGNVDKYTASERAYMLKQDSLRTAALVEQAKADSVRMGLSPATANPAVADSVTQEAAPAGAATAAPADSATTAPPAGADPAASQ